ncbi:MAG: phosphoenolpyruvate synthase, partial [archaeon]
METKRGPFDKLIEDAISSMDIDSDQKPVNVKTDPDKAFKEGVANAQKAEDIDFSKLRGGNNILNDNSNTNLNQVGSGYLNHEFEDQVGGGREPVNRGGLIRNKIAAIPIGGIDSDDYIKWFSELSNKDVQTAGGKGASLGEMFNSKFPVPPGFVITAQSFDYFMTKAGLKEKIYDIIKKVKMEDTEDLTRASKTIRKLIESEEIPDDLKKEILESYNLLGTEDINERGISQDALNILRNSQEPIFVSVRSSATTEDLVDASFAGQQESFLNVKGDSSLIEFVKKCFSSLYTPRAIYYRNKKGFTEGEALLAVVIQKMVDSEKSGVVFSRDPVRLDDNVVIEAVFGLGEGIVSGKIKPDHYVVSWDLKIKDVKIVNKKIAIVRTGSGQNETVKLSDEKSKSQVLTSAEVLEIANYAIKLEEHYKKPQDIEFATEGGEVYIVQSRPITTLGNKSESREISGNVILEGQSASPGIGSGVVKIIKSMEDLPKIKKGDILVTEMTNPDMVVAMQKSAAIVTDEGGMTSHAAIVSREMGIPCIVGTETATTVLKDGMRITVDGANGKVYEGEVAESQAVEIKPAVPTERIKIKVIVDLPDFAERAAKTGLDTVGLTRLEGIIASMKKHPLEYEKEGKLDEYSKIIEEGLGKILSYFKKVWFRASDLRTDEYSSLEGAPEREINPMLGFHGIRFSLKHPEILKAELNAMKRVAAKNPDKKIGIMFPQVILIEEVKEAKKYFNEVKLDNMEFGAMIETPAAVQIIEDICEEVDFISFGTNDLTQFTLAVDRNNEDVQYLYDELHPAIFSQIKKVIDACRKKNVETSICGQAGSKKQMAEFLFKKGISSISVNADAAYDISNLIKSMEEEWEKIKEERKQQEVKPVEVRRSEERNLEIEQKNQDISNIKTDDSVEIPKQAIEVQVTQGNQLRNTNNQQIRIENNQNQQGAINQDKINKKKEKWKRWKEKKKKWKEEKKK